MNMASSKDHGARSRYLIIAVLHAQHLECPGESEPDRGIAHLFAIALEYLGVGPGNHAICRATGKTKAHHAHWLSCRAAIRAGNAGGGNGEVSPWRRLQGAGRHFKCSFFADRAKPFQGFWVDAQ